MTVRTSVKERKPSPALVAVIASFSDLRRATRLRRQPDFFELRLDALHPLTPKVERLIAKLTRPLIITARHPQEGGRQNLSAAQRRQMLLRFLPLAAAVDVELRASRQLRSVLTAASAMGKQRIISVHDLKRTPSLPNLTRLADRALALAPDIFKLVARTDHTDDLARLLRFFDEQKKRLPMCAMGTGRLGPQSRRALWRRGTLLFYAHLGTALIPGQLSLAAARRLQNTAR